MDTPLPLTPTGNGTDGPAQWRVSGAFFLAGFGTFALIYDVQPLLPEFPHDFGVAPATASLALSLTTLTLSAAMLIVGRISELVNRRRLMSVSIVAGGLISILSAFAPDWGAFLALRALLGVALGGLPAVALAYLADNVPSHRLATTVGLYVSGTAFGGMSGRLIGGALTDALSWRHTVGIIGGLCLTAGVLFYFALPRRDRCRPAEREPLRHILGRFGAQWRDPVLRRLFLEGGLLLGCFVATFNYLCFRLLKPPFSFSQGKMSLVFLMYFAGVVVSPLCGRLIARFGLPAVLRGTFLTIVAGALVSLFDSLPFLLLGSVLVTVGFFAGHSTASGWVNRRAETGKAIASAQYLTVYYMGASLLGWLGGWAWQWAGWSGVAGMVGAAALAAVALVPRNGTDANSTNPR
ncbi:MAG: MFS transporter [Puniceicoccales bacterium]|jgi:YNFM family putative membrane transporter|nr:MFS transporter [Puniceicoccales bacterium]